METAAQMEVPPSGSGCCFHVAFTVVLAMATWPLAATAGLGTATQSFEGWWPGYEAYVLAHVRAGFGFGLALAATAGAAPIVATVTVPT